MISFSRSTTRRRATLCTRPADRPRWILRHRIGESSKPTRRSSTRRACWALTRLSSMSRGVSMACRMASLVISWKTIRRVRLRSRPSVSTRCQEMASPSRSSSEASQMISAWAAAFFSSATTFFFSAGTTYSGLNPAATSTLSFLSCRSRMCPKLDMTVKSLPKYF